MPFFLLALMMAADPNSISGSAALRVYEGSWQVTSKNAPSGSKPSLLVNECSAVGKFFACSQTVNGSQGNLIVFVPAGQPGRYYTQTILSEGRATGRDELEVAGNHWTYTSRRDQGGATTYFRTTNTFTDKNHIHFEQAQSTDNKQWTVQNAGDEVRINTAAKK
jgi:hypothetical protein